MWFVVIKIGGGGGGGVGAKLNRLRLETNYDSWYDPLMLMKISTKTKGRLQVLFCLALEQLQS